MNRMMLTAVALVVVSASCSGSNETCTNCPPVEGSWAMSYGAPAPACPGAMQPPSTLVITRVGSLVRADVAGTQLTGTLFDTFDFTLRGDFGDLNADAGRPAGTDGGALQDHAELRALYVPANAGDGGVDRLTGTWSFTPAFTQCEETRELNGTRQ